jgi:hypothetical protein
VKAKKAGSAMGIGVTSLLTIMAVLLLTSFAVLSLLSAKSDLLLSNKAADAIAAYYAADGEAEEWWMELCEFLGSAPGDGLQARLEAAGYTVEAAENGLVVRAGFAMGERKNLEVAVSIAENGEAAIIGWQSVPVYTAATEGAAAAGGTTVANKQWKDE